MERGEIEETRGMKEVEQWEHNCGV